MPQIPIHEYYYPILNECFWRVCVCKSRSYTMIFGERGQYVDDKQSMKCTQKKSMDSSDVLIVLPSILMFGYVFLLNSPSKTVTIN